MRDLAFLWRNTPRHITTNVVLLTYAFVPMCESCYVARMAIFGIINRKGGVGKSTSSINIAAALAASGGHVLLIDVDEQGTSADWYASRGGRPLPFECVHLTLPEITPEKFRLTKDYLAAIGEAHRLIATAIFDAGKRYDYVVVDAPPHDGAINRTVLVTADVVVMPAEPGGFSKYATDKTLTQLRAAQEARPTIKCGIVVSRKQPGTALGRDARDMLGELGLHIFKTELMTRTAIGEANTLGLTIFEHAPRSEAADEMAALTKEILKMHVDGRQDSAGRSIETITQEIERLDDGEKLQDRSDADQAGRRQRG